MPQREQVKISLPAALVAEMDKIRGEMTRSTWVQLSLENTLGIEGDHEEPQRGHGRPTTSGGSRANSAPHPQVVHADEIELLEVDPPAPPGNHEPDEVERKTGWRKIGIFYWANVDDAVQRAHAIAALSERGEFPRPLLYSSKRGEEAGNRDQTTLTEEEAWAWVDGYGISQAPR